MSNRSRWVVLLGATIAVMSLGQSALAYNVPPFNHRGTHWRTVETDPTAFVGFRRHPAHPPAGLGSAFLSVGNSTTGGDKTAELVHWYENPKPLTRLRALSYWTREKANDGQHWPTLVLDIDLPPIASHEVDDQVFFQPSFQNPSTGNPSCPDQGAAVLKSWQQWDAFNGCWWNANGDVGAPGAGVQPLSAYLVAHPDARVRHIRLVQGLGTPTNRFVGSVDAVLILGLLRHHPRGEHVNFEP